MSRNLQCYLQSNRIRTVMFTFVLCMVISGIAHAQQKITGVIIGASDQLPIVSATVKIKGTNKMAISNVDGKFSILAGKNQTLIFSALGFKAKEVAIKGATVINVTLTDDAVQLNETVVTALGIKREERALGYAATVIEGEDLTNAPSGNWTDALSGKVAGLNLVRANSGPAGSNKIILRGENNLTGDNEALIVVDGVVINHGSGRRSAGDENVYGTSSDNMAVDYGSNLNDLNPEDIESVTVLKGPGAAALYGERGANGAIIITTKSGTNKKGLGITFNSNASIETINRWPDLQFEYGQGTDGNNYYSFGASEDGGSTSGTSSAWGPKFDGQLFYQYDPSIHGQGAEKTPWLPYTDKVNDYFVNASTFTNSVSVAGGTDKTSARFSVSNAQNKWIAPNTGYERTSVALSVNSKVNKKLTISSKAAYNNKGSDNLPGAGYGNQSIMYWYIFWQPNGDLDWLKDYWVDGQEGKKIKYPYSTYPENPYAIAYEFINKSKRHAITGNITANYEFTKELSLQLRTSLDVGYENRAQERPYDAGTKLPKGSYRTQAINSQEVNADFLLKYNKKINEDFNISAFFGGSMLKNDYHKDEIRADSLVYPGIYTAANSKGPLVTLPYRSEYGINSFYGMVSTSYKDILYLDLTGRQDWNSTLATPERTENAGFFYPSANLSFVASDVIELPKQISFAKLRFSASKVGSGTTRPYRTAYNYVSGGSLYSGGLQNPSTLANPDLRSLSTTTFELGTDIRFFKSRLNLDVAVYTGNTKDQILERIIDQSAGFGKMIINAGTVRNRGLEIAINAKTIKSKNGLNWNTMFTFAANDNEIISLPDSSIVLQTGKVGGGQIVAKVGGSMGDLYGLGYVRSPDGQIVFDSETGNALIGTDVVYLGNTIPKGKISIGNEFRYKQFRLNFLFDAQYGAVAHSLLNARLSDFGKNKATLPGRYNGIIGNGVIQNEDGTYSPNNVIATDIAAYYQSVLGAANAEGATFSTDFIKFREARFDYTLSSKLTKRLGLQKASIGVYGRDLFIWSPWPAFDPEFGTLSGTDIVRGFEIAQFPSTRTFGLNLSVAF